MKNFITIFLTSCLIFSCSEPEIVGEELILELPETPYSYSQGDEIATLGRVLFYDKQLSINNTVSCASCHKQSIAFADN